MDAFYQYLGDLFTWAKTDSWAWFASLSREEWLIVLAVGCAGGFLCMRGYGSRSNY